MQGAESAAVVAKRNDIRESDKRRENIFA